MLGMTNDEIAEFFDVNVDSIHEWRKQYPSFSDAIKRGKEEADAEVAHKLYRRATGYSHPDVHIATVGGAIVQTEIEKHYPPDTAAAFIWLKNRQGRRWKDKQEVEHSGPNGGPIQTQEVIAEEAGRRIAYLLNKAAKAR